MGLMDKLDAIMRRVQTLESQVADLLERPSSYASGTGKNPNTGVFVADSAGSGVAKLDYDSASGTVRVTKVR